MSNAQSDAAKNLMVAANRERFRPMKDCETTRSTSNTALQKQLRTMQFQSDG